MRLACSFTNEADGNLVANHARRDRRHVSARGVGCPKGVFFLPPRAASPMNAGSLTDRAFSPRLTPLHHGSANTF